jgi:hypothetical protein
MRRIALRNVAPPASVPRWEEMQGSVNGDGSDGRTDVRGKRAMRVRTLAVPTILRMNAQTMQNRMAGESFEVMSLEGIGSQDGWVTYRWWKRNRRPVRGM